MKCCYYVSTHIVTSSLWEGGASRGHMEGVTSEVFWKCLLALINCKYYTSLSYVLYRENIVLLF